MSTIYVLSGLANDYRVFKYIDFGDNEIVHIPWIIPEPKETLHSYTLKMCEHITATNPILIGLSFGGIMAIEIAKHIDVKKIILLSSIKTHKELPFYLKWFGKTGLQHIIPPAWVLRTNAFVFWFLRLKEKEHKTLFTQLFKETNPWVYKWSANQVLTWKNTKIPRNIYHIHGNNDTILPSKFTTPDYVVNNGGHFMVVTHAQKISKILIQKISSS